MAGAEGGRFDFDDGGSYVGEWCEGRAHGLGIATGPDNQGEYSGEWAMGFESRGVYVWPSGNLYAGGWLKGKRHGDGVQVKGRWIYRGAFTAGFCGRYGVKESLTSCAKYEGSWHLNQFDGFGVETNSDGSTYCGAWSKGMRQGLGVRKSAPYGLASENNRAIRAAQSQSSLPSAQDSDRGWRGAGSSGGGSGDGGGGSLERGRSDVYRSGFVLRSASCPPPNSHSATLPGYTSGYRSATPTDKKPSFRKTLIRKLRKQKSTGDLSSVGGQSGHTSACGMGGRFTMRSQRSGGSLRSNISGSSQITAKSLGDHGRIAYSPRDGCDYPGGVGGGMSGGPVGGNFFDMLDEPLGPNVVETYGGQWNEDRRSGYGVAERSDGLRYEGEWFNNKKDGYGVSFHPDGSTEEGRYKDNFLVQALTKRTKLYLLRHNKLKAAVEEAVKKAIEASKEAHEKAAEIANQRAQTARGIAATADDKGRESRRLSQQARDIASEFAPDFSQLGIEWEKQNHLLQTDVFNSATRATAQQNSQPTSPQSQARHANQNTATETPNSPGGLTVNSLEVSGGNRRGSFRSSFRRAANAAGEQEEIRIRQSYQQPQYTKHQNGSNCNRSSTSPPSSHPLSASAQQTQHPHQNPQVFNFATATMVTPTTMQTATLSTARVIGSSIETARPLLGGQLHAPISSTKPKTGYAMVSPRAAAGRPVARAATSGFAVPPPEYPGRSGKDGALGELDFLGYQRQPRTRRRTLPSIMTEPPVGAPLTEDVNVQGNSTHTAVRGNPNPVSGGFIGNRSGGKMFTVSGLGADLDGTQSVENLVTSRKMVTYIIENGVRKRVETDVPIANASGPSGNPGLLGSPHLHNATSNSFAQPQHHGAVSKTGRPDAGMQRRFGPAFVEQVGSRQRTKLPHLNPDYDQSQLLPLPNAYRIESEANLAGGLETSMPDIHRGVEEEEVVVVSNRNRVGVSGLLTREEVSKLSQARRHELLQELERKQRGEIVIRLADIKDWLRSNFVLVLVLLINACLAFLFINLMSSNDSGDETTYRATPQSPQAKQAAATAAEKAIKKALRAANAAVRPKTEGNDLL